MSPRDVIISAQHHDLIPCGLYRKAVDLRNRPAQRFLDWEWSPMSITPQICRRFRANQRSMVGSLTVYIALPLPDDYSRRPGKYAFMLLFMTSITRVSLPVYSFHIKVNVPLK
jgi:hypothetical protein